MKGFCILEANKYPQRWEPLCYAEVSLEDAKYWLEKQVPIIRAAHLLEQRFDNLDHVFEFWTTGPLSADALTFLEERKALIKKYDIRWRGPAEVAAEAARLKNKTMSKLLKRYYQKDPLLKA